MAQSPRAAAADGPCRPHDQRRSTARPLDHRITASGIVFGLSPAQQRLARLLIDGHDLAAAAKDLPVSVNTARTQLQRIFDKTGVHTQSALVRVLLSIAPPLG
jgi:DNA-binding CsgD family transcriptional regulator